MEFNSVVQAALLSKFMGLYLSYIRLTVFLFTGLEFSFSHISRKETVKEKLGEDARSQFRDPTARGQRDTSVDKGNCQQA